MRRNELNSVGDVESAAGRSVMVVGFPTPTKPEHLLGYLRSRNFYPAEGSLDNVIKLKTYVGLYTLLLTKVVAKIPHIHIDETRQPFPSSWSNLILNPRHGEL